MSDTSGTTAPPAAGDQQGTTPSAPAPAAPQAPAPAPSAPPAAPAGAPAAPAPQAGAQGDQQQTTTTIEGVDTTGWPQSAIDAYLRRDGQAKTYQQEAGDRRVALRNLVSQVAPDIGITLPDDDSNLNPQQIRTQMAEAVAAERRQGAIAFAALEHRVPADKVDYLGYLVQRNAEAQGLDTTSPEFRARISTIVQGEIQRDASLLGTGAQAPVASVPGVVGNGSEGTALTVDAFKAMNGTERSALYMNDRAQYDRLAAESY